MFIYKIYVENDIIVKTEVCGAEDELPESDVRFEWTGDYGSDLAFYEAMANQILEQRAAVMPDDLGAELTW